MKKRTLERQVGTTIVPDQQGESVGIGRAKGFHQNHPREVQPKRGLTVTQALSARTYAILDLQRAQVQLDRVYRPFDTCLKERGDFQPGVNSSENELLIIGRSGTNPESFIFPLCIPRPTSFSAGLPNWM